MISHYIEKRFWALIQFNLRTSRHIWVILPLKLHSMVDSISTIILRVNMSYIFRSSRKKIKLFKSYIMSKIQNFIKHIVTISSYLNSFLNYYKIDFTDFHYSLHFSVFSQFFSGNFLVIRKKSKMTSSKYQLHSICYQNLVLMLKIWWFFLVKIVYTGKQKKTNICKINTLLALLRI